MKYVKFLRERRKDDHFVESSPFHFTIRSSHVTHENFSLFISVFFFFFFFSRLLVYLECGCYPFDVVGALNKLTTKLYWARKTRVIKRRETRLIQITSNVNSFKQRHKRTSTKAQKMMNKTRYRNVYVASVFSDKIGGCWLFE